MSWVRLIALSCAMVAAVSVARAQSSASIDFSEAARRTLASQPQLRRLSIDLDISKTREAVAALRAPIEVGAEFENVAGSGALQGVDAAEITLSVNSLFERGDKRAARIAEAQRYTELLSIEQRIVVLDALAETGKRFITAAVAQETADIAQRRATQAKQTLDLITTRVTAGRSPRTEKLYAEIELSAAEAAAVSAEGQLDAARRSLAAQWGDLNERPVVRAGLDAMPEPRSFEQLSAQLAVLPDLQRYAAEERLREAELRLARSQAVADWRWSAGVRRLEEVNEQALVVGFSVPVGTAKRNASLVRAAELQQSLAPLDAEARRLELIALLYAQWQELRSSRAAAVAIFDSQLPRAREALDLTRRGYEIGRFPYRELAIAQQQVLTLESLRIEAAACYHSTRIDIERLTGAQLALLEGTSP